MTIGFLAACHPRDRHAAEPVRMRAVSSRAFLYASQRDALSGRMPVGRLAPRQECLLLDVRPSGEWIISDIARVTIPGDRRARFIRRETIAVPVDFDAFDARVGEDGNLPVGREPLGPESPLPWKYEPTDLVAVNEDRENLGFPMTVPGRRIVGIRLRREALTAFERMFADAREEGSVLVILSGYRSADEQLNLYSGLAQRIPKQRTVARPSFSEHQLGTTADVAAPSTGYRLIRDFEVTREARWIRSHARGYGIIQSLGRDRHESQRLTYEPWHLRYVGVSRTFAEGMN